MSNYNIYGVKNDGLIFKLLEILDEFEVAYTFFDYKNHLPTDEQLLRWANFQEEEYPVNTRSSFFKKNKKHFLRLEENERMNWLRKNYNSLLRPIVEDNNELVLSIGGRPERIAQTIFNINLHSY